MLNSLLSFWNILPTFAIAFLLMELFLNKTEGIPVEHNGVFFRRIPSIQEMRKAVKLNSQFKEWIQKSDAIFVLGGEKCTLSDPSFRTKVLSMDFSLDTIEAIQEIPFSEIKTSFDFYSKTSDPLSSFLEERGGYSVLCIQDKYHVIAALHCAIETTKTHVFYETVLFFGPNLSEKLEYRICARATESGWTIAPMASHCWYEGGDEPLEAGVFLSLPDPYLTPGARDQSFSRFTYFEDALR